VTKEVLRSLGESDRLRLEAVLAYHEDSAGGLMDPDTLTVRDDVTVEVVLRYLRMRKSIPEGTDAIFVVTRRGEYEGCLFITTLLTADPEDNVSALLDTQLPAINAATPAADVALLFENYDLVSAAVVDDEGMLLGRITIDDVVDVIRAQGDHSVLSMAGLDEDDDMFAPVLVSARRHDGGMALRGDAGGSRHAGNPHAGGPQHGRHRRQSDTDSDYPGHRSRAGGTRERALAAE